MFLMLSAVEVEHIFDQDLAPRFLETYDFFDVWMLKNQWLFQTLGLCWKIIPVRVPHGWSNFGKHVERPQNLTGGALGARYKAPAHPGRGCCGAARTRGRLGRPRWLQAHGETVDALKAATRTVLAPGAMDSVCLIEAVAPLVQARRLCTDHFTVVDYGCIVRSYKSGR